jgi:amino acid adenylation domain-containing protein
VEPVPTNRSDGPLVASLTQEWWWLAERFVCSASAFNVSDAVRISGRLDPDRLARAVRRVVLRHEPLHTCYRDVDGRPQPSAAPVSGSPLQIVEVEGWSSAREMCRKLASEPFDLAAEIPVRAALLRMDEDDWLLIVIIHHISTDGWSTTIFWRELAAFYRDAEPPPLPLRYSDFARWQRDHLVGETLSRQLDYWRERLAGLPALELPGDRPRPPVMSGRAESLEFVLPRETVQELDRLASISEVTIFTILFAGFMAALARWSGQADFAIGTPVAYRPRREFEGLIGFMSNTLPLRTDMSDDPSFGELVRRVWDGLTSAYDHQDVPFGTIVEELKPPRFGSRPPYYQVLFALNEDETAAFEINDARTEPFTLFKGSSEFDLNLTIVPRGDQIVAELEFATDLFEAATAGEFANSYRRMLADAAADPGKALSQLEFFTQEQVTALITEQNDTEIPLSLNLCVHEMFAEQAHRRPSAIAIRDGKSIVTYAELETQSNQLAHLLRCQGVRPETAVGVLLERSAEMIVALVATLKAGGVYVPIDPSHPVDRVRRILSASAANLLVSTADLLRRIRLGQELATVLLDADECRIASMPETAPSSLAMAENLAYTIFTSGSSGEPKGVMVPHRGLINLAGDVPPCYESSDIVAAHITYTFDFSLTELLLPLAAGATIALVPSRIALDGAAFANFLDETSVTLMLATPTTWRLVLDGGWAGAAGFKALVGGDAVPPALAAELAARVDRLWHAYGPTETTIFSTAYPVAGTGTGALPLGGPIANTRLYLLNSRLEPVPYGAAAEIFLGGIGVARGYIGRPDLTAEHFVPDPFSAGDRLYCTGDLARRRRDGVLEFLGRVDSQIKLRGYRIELGEVEASLARHPWVAAAVARVHGEHLIGYVVPCSSGIDIERLRADLRAELPEYLVPARILTIGELPVTANGKLDRSRLPAPSPGPAHEGYVAPRTDQEQAMAAIWSDVLGLSKAGIRDDFFELGGHSLAAVQIAARVRRMFGQDVSVQLLLRHPTISDLTAELIRRRPGTENALTPRPLGAAAPLSHIQRQMWLLDRFQPGRTDYNEWVPWHLHGPLDLIAFERAVRRIVERHEVLRIRIELGDTGPVQLTSPVVQVTSVTDLAHLPSHNAESTARELIERTCHEPFDLATGPLIRVRLFRIRPDHHIAVFVIHHIAGDHSSFSLMWNELAEAYAAFQSGRKPELPALPVQYADFAYWQQTLEQGDLSYWQEKLAGLPACSLPEDRPRPALWSGRGSHMSFAFPLGASAAIRSYARERGATLFMVLLAGFEATLARISGQSDIVVGTPVTGRDREEMEPLIGCFLNTLVLRADLSGDPSFAELTRIVRGDVVGSLEHQEIPFEQLVDLHPDRDLSRNPLFQVLFGLESPHGGLNLPGVSAELIEDTSVSRSKLDLSMYVHDNPGELTGTIEFATDLFDVVSVRHFARCYVKLLESAVAEPDRRLSRLDILPAEACGEHRPGSVRCLHEMVAARAAADPGRIAVRQGEMVLSYGALEQRADRLARRLCLLGAGPGRVVGVVMDRSPELVIALLAVLKTGAAYVSADPAQPRARLVGMLRDSQAVGVLVRHPLGLPAEILLAEDDDPAPDVSLPAVSPDTAMAIYFTSGSTGRPKGVVLTHRGVANFLDFLTGTIGLGDDDVVLQLSAPSFDASIRDLLGPLVVGGRVILVEPEDAGNPHRLLAAIRQHEVTALVTLVPSMVSALAMALTGPEADSLRLALVSGEQLTGRHIGELRRLSPDVRVVNMYGPTECTMTSTYHVVGADEPDPTPIGRPIPNALCLVLGAHGELLPAGAVGDLHIATPGLALGYLRDPASTAERFVPAPFGPPGSRWFRTGDRVRRHHDGRLTFHGRLDDQVKIRGVRVEPAEVETAIRCCAGISAAAVAARDGQLVAYVVPEDGPIQLNAVRRELGAVLPGQLVPSRYVVLNALPLTPHGKVDRRRLPGLDAEAATANESAPRDSLELRMSAVWARVLGRRAIGITDDFFTVGGHSLKAVELVDTIRRELGIEIPPTAVFQHPTVERLCGAVECQTIEPGGLVVPLAEGVPRKPKVFIVHPQSGDIFSYVKLARFFTPEWQIYGIEAVGYSSDEPPLESISEMADRYVREMLTVAPKGPYYLAGWSFGGSVAAHMAARLEAAGNEVAFLGVIDARVFGQDDIEGGPAGSRALEKYALAAGLTDDVLADLTEDDALTHLLAKAKEKGIASPGSTSAAMRRIVNVFAANDRAAERRQDSIRLITDIHLFKATGRHEWLPAPVVEAASWQRLTTGSVRLIHVPGNHHDMLSDTHVGALAAHLAEALRSIHGS